MPINTQGQLSANTFQSATQRSKTVQALYHRPSEHRRAMVEKGESMDRLAGVKSKIERAKKHVHDLDRAKLAFLASDPYTVVTEFYSETGNSVSFLDRCDPIPDPIPLIAGDAAHNLRSALDHLTVALVEANHGTVGRRTAFPICECVEKYIANSPGQTEGIRQEAKKVIDGLKPYQGGNNVFWGIHELDRIDKHRVLITVNHMIATFGVEMGPEELNQIAPHFIRFGADSVPRRTHWYDAPATLQVGIKQGDPFFSVNGNFEKKQNVKFTFDIAFAEPEVLRSCPIIPALSTAVQVVEHTLTSLAPFLV
jgi:hypothetical protein